ncbi:MAG: preprotein translocase subunit SecE [Phenylobacterium sp.]|jgi:preprotein translocase subunit SecE|uniref:preprotein translocase subunit SecE n=1 Tax=Phenylobacterium sp. TaxID=1871053 RepID=UPI0025EBA982|nr:preprotein translocase subunit SecE [Phenylobacterium sp.]MCA3710453.1 preprotein translocase subunit SecE [Phenylobacterium sp.]MCA3712261.1 preprotein translocase subunit SecE [Phenylobacterium sp.]MCA3715240.1 preprotein translocase subunit SecE [Phenylobacterium sp.]MCA3724787.1 preprotein translocase subunit SecE [Phenylobacterium sp.]MCA3726845.1 preprotein translocase subunit SecE [Phenylobacterium sp.]
MARNKGSKPQAMKERAARTAAAVAPSSALATGAAPKKRVGLLQFLREVRAEGRKITWTTPRETWITSVFVGIMVVVAALFLQLVDLILGWSLSFILNFANGG